MLCLKKRRTYSFTQGACAEAPRYQRRSTSSSRYNDVVNVTAACTLPRKHRAREERPSSAMVLTVTEDTPADMLAGSMELLVQIPRDQYLQTHRVTVQRSTPMMDLLVQIATAHKLAASSYTLQAIGERGLVLPHQPNTPIGALDALQVKLLPKQGTFLSRKNRQPNQPFETTFRLQVHLPRNQLYVSRVSPKTNLGEILDEVCREKNLDRNKYELRHPVNISETLDLGLSLQDYQIQEVNLYPRQSTRTLSSQDIMAFQRQEECRRQQQHSRHHGVFSFMFKRSKESSLSTDSLGNRSVSPARSDETARSSSPVQRQQSASKQQFATPAPVPARPLRKRRPAPKPPTDQRKQTQETTKPSARSASENGVSTRSSDSEKIVISHSRNSSDSSGYHEASVLSDNPDNINHNGSGGRMPETLPRRGRMQGILESPRKLAHTSHASKSLSNLAMASSQAGTLSRGISNTSLSSTGQRKKRAAPPPPIARPLPSAISVQGLERIVDSDESLTSDMELSKPSSDIDAAATGSSQASSDIACHVRPMAEPKPEAKQPPPAPVVESARVVKREKALPVPKPRSKTQPAVEPSSKPASRSSSIASAEESYPAAVAHGLPSLTEDEREEINLAIDSIYVAATGHSGRCCCNEDDSSMSIVSDCQSADAKLENVKNEVDVFYDAEAKGVDAGELPDRVVSVAKVSVEETKSPVVENMLVEQELVENVSNCRIIVTNEELLDIEPPEEFKGNEFKAGDLNKLVGELDSECRDELDLVENLSSSARVELEEDKTEKTCGSTCTIISMILKNNSPNSRAELCSGDSSPEEKTIGESAKNRGGSNDLVSSDGGQVVGCRSTEASTVLGSGKPAAVTSSVAATTPAAPTDTDILLQKVSDTLSQALVPPSPSPTSEDREDGAGPPLAFGGELQKQKKQPKHASLDAKPKAHDKSTAKSIVRTEADEEEEQLGDGSAQNLTAASQQDTSDYVSASGEDLSIGDWEYQIPAPPSAFRDDSDAEPAAPSAKSSGNKKDSISIEAEIHQPKQTAVKKSAPPKEAVKKIEPSLVTDSVDFAQPKPPKPIIPHQQLLSNDATEQKKAEVISELETKISSGKPVAVPVEATRDYSYAPKIAPVENNLANFTITTYSRQRSLDIFEPVEQSPPPSMQIEHTEARILGTFATLTRGKNITDYNEDRSARASTLKNTLSMERVSMPLVDDRAKFAERHEVLRDKPVHRSKSYIVLASNEKFQNRTGDQETSRDEKKIGERPSVESNGELPRKYTSLANVNTTNDDLPRKEKFSQWRENILKRQEDPSPEKQLQSLQSILPHLKNAQATDTNDHKNGSDSFSARERQESLREELRATSPPVVSHSEVKSRPATQRRNYEASKRYTYAGPPAISLGSWAERPSLNVQIKSDTDYKLGGSALSGARTVVSLNSEPTDEKKPASPKTTSVQVGKTIPVQLKPAPIPVNAKEPEVQKDEPSVDTSSVSFSELTKAFGQEVRMRPKPPVTVRAPPQQRHSEYFERDSVSTPRVNGFADSHVSVASFKHNRTNGPVPAVKRYTSVVGITNNNDNDMPSHQQQTSFRFMNGQTKTTPAPVTKAFNGLEKNNTSTVPKPPTMPIITGVTLKSVNARPKSSLAMTQQDPRDQLLESIRNFGGREKLKKAAERC
ncbi:uncharacterized protein LOC106638249 isoform X2 [Copidosoma floridanum]|uniref:uncharacterized protein LOC106638249 isoform X2 n=1 Tax=Copidosoma floridanum TaxID=29053 RepID=UPI000C6FA820|nr:uncharacterized protein LOC106638249 isoform X2 [Copidosoma floridanum]